MNAYGSRIRNEKVAFSNENGYVWTGPKLVKTEYHNVLQCVSKIEFLQCATLLICRSKEIDLKSAAAIKQHARENRRLKDGGF